MRLDASKIDERIKKLQEIQRIAADPEMLQMLYEFIDVEEESTGRSHDIPKVMAREEGRGNVATPEPDEASELISGVVNAVPAFAKRLRA